MEILISLLIFCVVLGLIWWLIGLLPLPAPFGMIVRVVFVIICILGLISYLPIGGHGYFYR